MDKKTALKLSVVFGLVYFFSTNGMASLPAVAVSFLLKDVLHMTASQAAYFNAVTMLGWLIKPVWGIISDVVPILGYRRKSWLIITTSGAAMIWFYLGAIETPQYTATLLITLFTASAMFYAFNDVVCDGLMVETGQPHNLTGKFQVWQWSAVYLAAIITGVLGGYAAEHLSYQKIFTINGIFPLIILAAIVFFVKEGRSINRREQVRASLSALKEVAGKWQLWAIALFMFAWTFSPSFGAPFFYFAVDRLGFGKVYLGLVSTIAAIGSLLGTLAFNRYENRFETNRVLYFAIALGTIVTLLDLIYFTQFMIHSPMILRTYNVVMALIMGILTGFSSLVLLNLAARICPKWGEGTTFAALVSFWNVGLMGSQVLGGYLFDKVGLQPLIVISAAFTAITAALVPFLRINEE